MNFLQDVLDSDIENASKTKDTISSVNFINIICGKAEDRQMNRIKAKIKEYDDAVKKHNDLAKNSYAKEDDKKWKEKEQLLQKDVVNYISGLKIKPKTMQILISKALAKNGMNSKYRRKLLNSLYQSHREKFMSCFKSL